MKSVLCAFILVMLAVLSHPVVANAQVIGFSNAQATQSFNATSSAMTYSILNDATGAQANSEMLTFTCTAGPCLTESPLVSIRMSGNAQLVTLALNATNLTSSTTTGTTTVLYASGSNVLADGTYSVVASYVRASNGQLRQSSTLTWSLDGRTQPPVLSSPTASSLSGPGLAVAFTLPDEPLASSVQLTFMQESSAICTLTLNGVQGANAGTLDLNDLLASPLIVSASGALPDGTYDVVLSYRDSRPHEVASASVTGVTIRTATPAPIISSPIAASTYDLPLSIDYSLPVTPNSGTVQLHVTDSSGTSTTTLSEASTGTFTIGASSDLPAGTYRLAIAYQDALGNPEAETRVENVRIRRPDMTLSMQRSGSFQVGAAGLAYALTVTNSGDGPTFAQVEVTDTLAPGIEAVSMSGLGWSCRLDTATCVRSDVLAPGASYPPIELRVQALESAAGEITNSATVSGGGERPTATSVATDNAVVLCALGAFFGDGDACTACSGACASGEFLSAECAASNDRVCSSCASIAHCASVACTTADDEVCTACDAGYFVAAGACQACTASCSPGMYRVASCGGSNDTQCAPCPMGTYSLGGTAETCTPCAAGTYAATTGSTSCQTCAPGSDSMPGANTCTDCNPESETCVLCEAGQYPNHAERACLSCPAGTYSTPESMACIACAPGTFASSAQAESCQSCAAGSFATAPGAVECELCPAGTFAAADGSARCTLCPVGTYAAVSGSTTCSACASCEDADPCTVDVCDPIGGCEHRAIAGCVNAADAGAADGSIANNGDGGVANNSDGSIANNGDGSVASGSGSGCTVSLGSQSNAASTLWLLMLGLTIARRRKR